MLVEVLLDARMHVQYGFLDLHSAQVDPSDDAWRGQVNGLMGAAVPELLRLRTVLHTGDVGVRIELHSAEPPVGDAWGEVVQAPFACWVDDLTVGAFEQWEGPLDLPPGTYEVRYCLRDDRLLLQFWPAAGVDRIVRQTGTDAAGWHRTGVAPAWTAGELTERIAELRLSRETGIDAPDEPEPRLLSRGTGDPALVGELPPAARMLAAADLDLARGLTAAGAQPRREVLCWAVEQALTVTRLRHQPWAAEAMAALYRGEPQPADLPAPAASLSPLPGPAASLSPLPAPADAQPDGGDDAAVRAAVAQHVAVSLLRQAFAGGDGLEAACDALWIAGTLLADGKTGLLDAARQMFPHLLPGER